MGADDTKRTSASAQRGSSPGSASGSTFGSFVLDPENYKGLHFDDMTSKLLNQLRLFTDERREFYESRRRKNAGWVFGSRTFLAVAGAGAVLLTATAAGLQLEGELVWGKWALILTLFVYALMGAVAFYDRATNREGTYFRAVSTILSIRDLWTKLEFEVLKELTNAWNEGADPISIVAARTQLFALAQAYCADVDKITTSEETQWQTEFQAAGGQLEEAMKKGATDTMTQFQALAAAAKQAAETAKASADAAKAAADSLRPGQVNLSIKGDFEGEVTVLLDDIVATKTPGRWVALAAVPAGVHKLIMRGTHKGQALETAQIFDIKAGLQSIELSF